MRAEHQAIWERAKPYLNTRSNDKHTWYCYYFAEQLLASHPAANAQIVLPALLLHDVGWSAVPEDKQLQSFGPHMIYPELRRLHETEGARIAQDILHELDTGEATLAEIIAIIDGHDTREDALSLHDALVKDADKLWRYTPFGLETQCGWFQYSTDELLDLLHKWIQTRFYTDAGRDMARGLYAQLLLQHRHLFQP